jgi:hypothetical protein
MYKLVFVLLLTLKVISGCSSEKQPEISNEQKSELRSDANEFMNGLKNVLISEIQSNGLKSAVSVCSDTAQVMTNDYSVQKGIYIKRVSFNNRNNNNTPDLFETEGLNYFQKILDEGRLDSLSEYFKIVEEDEVKYLRYMKPILVQAPCLNCHGSREQIVPEVLQIIDKRYQNDKAVNYQIGDLRGAVSIQKVL